MSELLKCPRCGTTSEAAANECDAYACPGIELVVRAAPQKTMRLVPEAKVAEQLASARKAALEEAAAAFETYALDQRACIARRYVTGRAAKDAAIRAEAWEDAAKELREAATPAAQPKPEEAP